MSNQPALIQNNIPLAPYTTFKIGGSAKFLAAPKTIHDVQSVLHWATANALPFRGIGRGANVLVADAGFDGLVIVLQNDQMIWQPPLATVGAGVQNGQLIANALEHHLGGLQWFIGVPGTVGGSLYGNAGGHGWGLGDAVDWVEAVLPSGELKRLTKDECQFAYRTSVFKQHPDWIIVQAQLHLSPVDAAAERVLLATTTATKNAAQPTTEKTAGCMFTNPTADREKLPKHLQDLVDADGKIAAWRVIDDVGLKGRQLGQMQISEKHCNFMINLGGGTADQVMQLISLVKQKVRDKYGIQLHEEVQYLGF